MELADSDRDRLVILARRGADEAPKEPDGVGEGAGDSGASVSVAPVPPFSSMPSTEAMNEAQLEDILSSAEIDSAQQTVTLPLVHFEVPAPSAWLGLAMEPPLLQ